MPKDSKSVLDEYRGWMTEVVPGVFIDGIDSVHIVDDQGEVCMWNSAEWEENSEAVIATVNAAILAAVRGAAAVRENIAEQGTLLEGLIRRTRRLVGRDPQEVPDCLFVDNGVDGHVTIDGRYSFSYHVCRIAETGGIAGVYIKHVSRSRKDLLRRAREALGQRYDLNPLVIQLRKAKQWPESWRMDIQL